LFSLKLKWTTDTAGCSTGSSVAIAFYQQ
jgi:hypothetical protein